MLAVGVSGGSYPRRPVVQTPQVVPGLGLLGIQGRLHEQLEDTQHKMLYCVKHSIRTRTSPPPGAQPGTVPSARSIERVKAKRADANRADGYKADANRANG